MTYQPQSRWTALRLGLVAGLIASAVNVIPSLIVGCAAPFVALPVGIALGYMLTREGNQPKRAVISNVVISSTLAGLLTPLVHLVLLFVVSASLGRTYAGIFDEVLGEGMGGIMVAIIVIGLSMGSIIFCTAAAVLTAVIRQTSRPTASEPSVSQ